MKIETVQIDLTESLFNLTESVDGANDQEDLVVECEEIVKNITEEEEVHHPLHAETTLPHCRVRPSSSSSS